MPNTPIPQQTPLDRGAGRIARNRTRIAWMYYVEGLTQNEIAERLGIGRVTVVRNIDEAIKQREVKIRIEGEIAECIEIEKQLKQAFKLQPPSSCQSQHQFRESAKPLERPQACL